MDVKVSCLRVARLMRKAKIRSIVKRKFRITTNSEHKYLDAEISSTGNSKWIK
ncbi:hypothetical protein IEE83_09375 [Dyadobacter sp. UP-52]|uniref:Transposase n=1 Tax=Dyadobacter subterraneus TaxID=2773304 RepID=A0ABR9W9C4_9BACT|nr:hypothetical protein [Dyadobacter subterraneus]